MSKFVFFRGGPYSQWFKSPFIIDGMQFNCCEQWMMYQKAKLFGDKEFANAIMRTNNPREQKRLGREVRNFNDEVWMEHAYDLVVKGNRAKFSQNPDLLKTLEGTKGKVLVEASPYDKRWGIGLAEGAEGIENPANWKGENLLGQAITEVRIELFNE